MKRFLILLFIFLANNVIYANDDYGKLIEAISIVESGQDPNKVSKNGKFVGLLQISKVVVEDCNRIIGNDIYDYSHRYDADKSIEMFLIIQNYYNPKKDLVKAIRIWNEGPSYNKKLKSTPYLKKVMYEYKKL